MKDKLEQRLSSLACGLLLLSLPTGVAGQTLALFFASLLSVWIRWRTPAAERAPFLANRSQKAACLLYLGFIFFQLLATLLNPTHPNQEWLQHGIGFMAIVVAPPLLVSSWRLQWPRLEIWQRLATGLLLLMTLVSISQAIWGWQLAGSGLEFAPILRRASGFYSHPLTFAYVTLLLWPLHFINFLRDWRRPQQWLNVICLLLIFYLSSSRVAILCAMLSIFCCVWVLLKGRQRLILISGLVLISLGVAVTKNPLSERYRIIFSEHNPDRFSSFGDDRLAFWSVFRLMIEERPWLGHGIGLNGEYRRPYYEAAGLGDFTKQYEAHNQLIQITAEGGVLALACFLLWLWLLLRSYPDLDRTQRLIMQQTLLVFMLGGLTQNAFQDSEVRFTLTFLLSLAAAAQVWQNRQLPQLGYKSASN